MGDNRNNSGDSRYHQDNGYDGTVSVNDVIGKAFAVMWPISRAQILYGTDAFNNLQKYIEILFDYNFGVTYGSCC